MPNSYQDGGCSCGQTRYQLKGPPLIVHACHCRMCQRLSGSTNAVNLLIEAENVNFFAGGDNRNAYADTIGAWAGHNQMQKLSRRDLEQLSTVFKISWCIGAVYPRRYA